MKEPEQRTDWSTVNSAIQRRSAENTLPIRASEDLAPPTSGLTAPRGSVPSPDNVVQSFKMKRVERRAAVQHLEAWYSAQLDVARHHLGEVARVRKAESTLVADQFLRHLNAQHLEYLTTLGLQNEAVRSRALLALNDQTSATLKDIQTRDWPEALVTSAIEGVLERQKRFMARLVNELGE